jgi:hypothetical protein
MESLSTLVRTTVEATREHELYCDRLSLGEGLRHEIDLNHRLALKKIEQTKVEKSLIATKNASDSI